MPRTTLATPQPGLWGGNPIHVTPNPIAVTSGGGSIVAQAPSTSPSSGPGVTMPGDYWQSQGRGGRGQGGFGPGGYGAGEYQQPTQISPGVFVYPDGTQVTGSQIQAQSEASYVPQASEQEQLLAEQEAAATAAPATTTTATTTSYFDESTIYPPYTNGQVILVGGGAAALLFLMFRKR
jgi:hypothetical protein